MTRIGMLTPSSNTVLEPITFEMVRDVPGVSVHFSRFKVTEIALSQQALGQFTVEPILVAAELLAHAGTGGQRGNKTKRDENAKGPDKPVLHEKAPLLQPGEGCRPLNRPSRAIKATPPTMAASATLNDGQ